MLMAGCCWLGCSERGALGFSNDRSLTYWARTLSCAGAACWPPACPPAWSPPAACPPLVGIVIRSPPEAALRSAGWLTRQNPCHKDDLGARVAACPYGFGNASGGGRPV